VSPRKNNKTSPSLISISDVLRAGRRMSTEEQGVARYLLPGLDTHLASIPAGAQGGDFYGMVYLQQGRTAVFVGDISGHDFSSSIVAAQVIEYIDNNQEALAFPHLFLHEMSNALYDTLNSVGRFFTAALCVADVERNTLTYASAGHPPSLMYSSEHKRIISVGGKSLPVGFEPDTAYQVYQRDFLPGDTLLIYTDGISSARSADKDEFGMQRLAAHVLAHGRSPRTMIPDLIHIINEFCAGAPGVDDITAICLSRG
jgi:serine phosphatase RsbU (regulator of sigma subunit)